MNPFQHEVFIVMKSWSRPPLILIVATQTFAGQPPGVDVLVAVDARLCQTKKRRRTRMRWKTGQRKWFSHSRDVTGIAGQIVVRSGQDKRDIVMLEVVGIAASPGQ